MTSSTTHFGGLGDVNRRAAFRPFLLALELSGVSVGRLIILMLDGIIFIHGDGSMHISL